MAERRGPGIGERVREWKEYWGRESDGRDGRDGRNGRKGVDRSDVGRRGRPRGKGGWRERQGEEGGRK